MGKRAWFILTMTAWLGASAETVEPADSRPEAARTEAEAPPNWLVKHDARIVQERYRLRVPLPAGAAETRAGTHAIEAYRPQDSQGGTASDAPSGFGTQNTLLTCAFLLAAILGLRKLAFLYDWPVMESLSSLGLLSWYPAERGGRLQTEGKALSEFAATMLSGPKAERENLPGEVNPPVAHATSEPTIGPPKQGPQSVEKFFLESQETLKNLQRLLQEISRAPEETARRGLLQEVQNHVRAMRADTGLLQVLPIWQLTSALEGLLKQLSAKDDNITPSILRTLASAKDLLSDLCVPGVRTDLAMNPPTKWLAVDDDPICRHAVASYLKRAFTAPDLAGNAEEAMVLAAQQRYDVIFLDVMMPGVDGFELCKKIHETPVNRHTPVLYVTCLTDFDARAKSTLSGGVDLIGKPFLGFEITVKALTLLMRNRLREDKANREGAAEPACHPAATNAPSPQPADGSDIKAVSALASKAIDRLAQVASTNSALAQS